MGRQPSIAAVKVAVLAGYAVALTVPALVFFHDRGGVAFLRGAGSRVVLQQLFPLAGLYGFTFLTMQILITTNLSWLTHAWPRVILFHRRQGALALLFALAHPGLILLGYGLASFVAGAFTRPGLAGWLIPAYLGLSVLVLTVITALLGWTGKRLSRWRGLHRLNYLAFALVWIHSWFIGTDTATTLLRAIWVLYLALVVASTIGRYRPQLRRRRGGQRPSTPALATGSPGARVGLG